MRELQLKDGSVLTYDDDPKAQGQKVKLNGHDTNMWEPVFLPYGDDEPQFFGFANVQQNKVYDIYGGVSNITDEDKVKL